MIVSFDCNSPSCAIKDSASSIHSLQTPLHIDELEFDMQPHAGIALFPADSNTPEVLLCRALEAADQAQELGVDPRYAFFCSGMGQRARDVAGVPIAINVAADQLASDDWIDGVQAEVDTGRMRPANLVCEITESVALGDDAGRPVPVADFVARWLTTPQPARGVTQVAPVGATHC